MPSFQWYAGISENVSLPFFFSSCNLTQLPDLVHCMAAQILLPTQPSSYKGCISLNCSQKQLHVKLQSLFE